jgi:hypothetical protein
MAIHWFFIDTAERGRVYPVLLNYESQVILRYSSDVRETAESILCCWLAIHQSFVDTARGDGVYPG